MRWRLAAALLIVMTTGVWLGGFAEQALHGVGQQTYAMSFRGARWVTSATPGPRAYFRLLVPLATLPRGATMWLDANQGASVFVNGRLAAANEEVKDAIQMPQVAPLDLLPYLTTGRNVVAVEVTNRDNAPTGLRARVTLDLGDRLSDLITGEAPWRGTTDLSLVKFPGAYHVPRFSSPDFNDGQWPLAVRLHPPRDVVTTVVPQAVMEAPLSGAVVAGPRLSGDITASVLVGLDNNPSDAWFRIAAPGRFQLIVNGNVLTEDVISQGASTDQLGAGHSGTGRKSISAPARLDLFNLGPYLSRGSNVIAVHVQSDPRAALYVDGTVEGERTALAFATGRDFGVSDSPSVASRVPPRSRGSSLGNVSVALPSGVTKVPLGVATLRTPETTLHTEQALAVSALVLLWLLSATVISLLTDLTWGAAAILDGAAHLPAAALIATVQELGRFPQPAPPGLRVSGVLLGLVAAVLASKLAVGCMACRVALRAPGRCQAARTNRLTGAPRGLRAVHFLARHPGVSVGAIAAGVGALLTYGLGYEPVWQDEVASLFAARGMRLHLIPRLPSTFVYWKGELFHALVAVIGGVAGDAPGILRGISVFWYCATVLAFGLLLLPVALGHRHWLQVPLTLIFATAPMELVWARDIRMYQQAQCLAIVFVALFLRALQSNRSRDIALSAAALVAMYLSHEETFVFLPAIPIVFLGTLRLGWVRDRRWVLLGGAALAVIAGQYALASGTHPPFFGFDHSNKPYVLYDPHNLYYYYRQVYFPIRSTGGSLVLASTLALVAGIVGVIRKSWVRIQLSILLWVPVVALSFLFSPKNSRYVFVTLPIVFVLSGLGAIDVLAMFKTVFTRTQASVRERLAVGRLVAGTAVAASVWLAISLSGGVSDYGFAVSRIVGQPTAHHHVDYGYVTNRLSLSYRPGDYVITLCPPNIPTFYLGRSPDAEIATGRDKQLFLMERNAAPVDTNLGRPVILTADQLRFALATHPRIWLITDQGPYLRGVSAEITNLILDEFRPIAEGENSALYFFGR